MWKIKRFSKIQNGKFNFFYFDGFPKIYIQSIRLKVTPKTLWSVLCIIHYTLYWLYMGLFRTTTRGVSPTSPHSWTLPTASYRNWRWHSLSPRTSCQNLGKYFIDCQSNNYLYQFLLKIKNLWFSLLFSFTFYLSILAWNLRERRQSIQN